ncbi:MAG: hypothetical protein V1816_23170 [Pseudomonadota bacterium]
MSKTIPLRSRAKVEKYRADEFLDRLGVDRSTPDRLTASLPFSSADVTCGSENELQAVVQGGRDSVDLPRIIGESNYFKNIIRRHRSGELSALKVSDLERWLEGDGRGVWENSWVRFPAWKLGPAASRVFREDLRRDKADPASGLRTDADRFSCESGGESMIRVPVSYLLKLALVDAVGSGRGGEVVRSSGLALAEHFLSDNTSPETFSLYLAGRDGRPGLGRAAASEMAVRFLLTQLLVQYAGRRFGLLDSNQKVVVYSAPHPPVRQKELAEAISDSFYRELFMNPCLSGWDRGEEKHRYMHLCHETLSRAQLNALGRLKEAGVIVNNLVVLPSSSNISLVNNGVHVSLGSRRLSQALAGPNPSINPAREKYFGDLVIKFVEHFLPLFVGTYSGAPYRLDFKDFHPEKVLSFLPYELDYTHLRMIWRRWRKKARLKSRLLGVRLTPFGPPLLDASLARLLGLRGDFLPDFRLLDYLASVLSTDQCPALDGTLGNQERLKKDLAELGVFDSRMPVYLLYRQRIFDRMGFSGFEGRHYSLFHRLFDDLAPAVDLQHLVTGLAFQFIASGLFTHEHVPDEPTIESERRQIFFGAAIGLPTFFVRVDTANLFLRSIVEKTPGVRLSRRYPGYWRVRRRDYNRALLDLLKHDAAPLVEALGLSETLLDLEARLADPEGISAVGKLTGGILGGRKAKRPLDVGAGEFNRAAEDYYRVSLRLAHLTEAFDALQAQAAVLARSGGGPIGPRDLESLARVKNSLLDETASLEEITAVIHLIVRVAGEKDRTSAADRETGPGAGKVGHESDYAPIYRQANP